MKAGEARGVFVTLCLYSFVFQGFMSEVLDKYNGAGQGDPNRGVLVYDAFESKRCYVFFVCALDLIFFIYFFSCSSKLSPL